MFHTSLKSLAFGLGALGLGLAVAGAPQAATAQTTLLNVS